MLSELQFTIDGKKYKVPIASQQAILDVLLENGYNIPYGCRSGFCTECKAKLLSGSVDMKVKTQLCAEDVKENYILTCQAYPTSKKLAITYDDIPLPPEFG